MTYRFTAATLAALMLWLMGSTGRYWWLWAWGSWMAFNLLLMVIFPTLIMPSLATLAEGLRRPLTSPGCSLVPVLPANCAMAILP